MSRNELEMANKLLESMKSEFQLEADSVVLEAMLDGLCSLEKIDEACWMYDRMEEEFRVSPTPFMFQKLILKLIKSKKEEHWVESARRMIQGLEKRSDFHLSNKLVYQILSQLGNRSVRLHREWRTRVYNYFNSNPQRFRENDAFFTSPNGNNKINNNNNNYNNNNNNNNNDKNKGNNNNNNKRANKMNSTNRNRNEQKNDEGRINRQQFQQQFHQEFEFK